MALWVLIGHVLLTFEGSGLIWTALTENRKAVNIFMTLSGFVIFFLLDREKTTYWVYIRRRFFRLYPAYILSFAAAVMLAQESIICFAGLAGSTRNLARIQIFQASLDSAPAHIVAHMTMLHGLIPWLPFSDYAFLGQAWSITLEWQFYLIAPFLFVLLRGPNLALRMITALIFTAALHKSRIFFGEGYIGSNVIWFALGIASFFVWRAQSGISVSVGRRLGWIVPLLALGWILVAPSNWQTAIWILVFGWCLSGAICARFGVMPPLCVRGMRRVLLHEALLWLGRVSYSIYLTHMLVMIVAILALERFAPALVHVYAVLPLTLIGTGIVAHIMYIWVERPFMNFSRRSAVLAPAV